MSKEKKKIPKEEIEKIMERARQLLGAVMLMVDPKVVYGKLKAFLDILNFSYLIDPKTRTLIVPIAVRDEGGNLHKHEIIITVENTWIVSRTRVISIPKIPADVRERLYKILLRANADMPECNFGIDKDDNIVLTQSILITALHFEGFAEEFLAIPAALKYFWSGIYPEIREEFEKSAEIT